MSTCKSITSCLSCLEDAECAFFLVHPEEKWTCENKDGLDGNLRDMLVGSKDGAECPPDANIETGDNKCENETILVFVLIGVGLIILGLIIVWAFVYYFRRGHLGARRDDPEMDAGATMMLVSPVNPIIDSGSYTMHDNIPPAC